MAEQACVNGDHLQAGAYYEIATKKRSLMVIFKKQRSLGLLL
ncbi:hypothetical protein [Nostoc sp. FACHB-892]|nr:hypothetical protein [Nostoc sp. FACHB-892]